MAATEVMDIVDNVIERLNKMTTGLDVIDEKTGTSADSDFIKEKTSKIRAEIDGSQEDLFSIMNALQFQDITTQQINSINETFDTVQNRLAKLLKGYKDDGITVSEIIKTAYDPNAEFDFERSAESQKNADEYLEKQKKMNRLMHQFPSLRKIKIRKNPVIQKMQTLLPEKTVSRI